MLDKLLTSAYLNLAGPLFFRPRPVPFTEVLRRAKRILFHPPAGAGEAWFALPALRSLKYHYQSSELAILLPEKRNALLGDGIGEVIKYGRLTPLTRSFRVLEGVLRARAFDLFLDLNPGLNPSSLVLSRLSGAEVRVGFARKKGFPFFNCQVPAQGGDVVERNLAFLRAIGVETKDAEVSLSVSEGARLEAARYLESRVQRPKEDGMLIGVDLDPGDGRRGWSPRALAAISRAVEGLLRAKFLIFHPPLGRGADLLRRSLGKSPLLLSGLTPNQAAAAISLCGLFITRKSDLFPIAYGLGVPTVLVLSAREASFFSPPDRDRLRIVVVRREGLVPVREVSGLARELTGP